MQEGEALSGRFEDTFSGDVPPPGHQGDGTGALTSVTSAEMHFDLVRSDGRELSLTFALALSNGNQTLTLTAAEAVIMLQRQ